jgi:hypothetical protein
METLLYLTHYKSQIWKNLTKFDFWGGAFNGYVDDSSFCIPVFDIKFHCRTGKIVRIIESKSGPVDTDCIHQTMIEGQRYYIELVIRLIILHVIVYNWDNFSSTFSWRIKEHHVLILIFNNFSTAFVYSDRYLVWNILFIFKLVLDGYSFRQRCILRFFNL